MDSCVVVGRADAPCVGLWTIVSTVVQLRNSALADLQSQLGRFCSCCLFFLVRDVDVLARDGWCGIAILFGRSWQWPVLAGFHLCSILTTVRVPRLSWLPSEEPFSYGVFCGRRFCRRYV